MTKSRIFISIVTGGMALVLQSTTGAFAQTSSSSAAPPPSAAAQRSAADLEKLVAPIALYPDPLIATILPASAYPLEIVEAARFVKDTNNIAKLDQQSWDDNVKAVARIPDVINKMNDDIAWTSDLGQAFVDQQKEVMDTIQSLRAKAQSAGTLKTTPQQVVVVTNSVVEKTIEQKVVMVTNTVVEIQPSNPQVVYVPTYDPVYVYAPPPGPPPIVTFAAGVAVGAIIANNCDWHGGGVYVGPRGAAVWGGGGYHGDVDINVNRNVNINNDVNVNRNVNNVSGQGQKWQPDQTRLHSSGAPTATKSSAARGWSNPSADPASTAASASAKTGPSGTRPPSSQGTDRSAPSPARSSGGPPAGSGGSPHESAFSKPGNAAGDRAAGQRGSASASHGGGFKGRR